MTELRYCTDCKSQDTWVRCPERDWLTETGKIFEYAYKCRMCGRITLRPATEGGG